LIPAANVTLAAPVTASAATSSGSVGAAAAARLKTPKRAAAPAIRGASTRSRAPETSAPQTAPTAIDEVSSA
jgi:hypothetical protein